MSLTEQISRATAVLDAVASLHLPQRLDAATSIRTRLTNLTRCDRHDGLYEPLLELRELCGEVAHVVEILANAAGESTFEGIPAVLRDLSDYWYRTYPPVPEDVEPEREILADLFPDGLHGRYVEIGAWRPVEQSNTWQFYQKGWSGLLIEPIPGHWPALLTQRPRDLLCPFAASDKAGWQAIWANGPTSSMRPDKNPEDTCKILVETRTLADILSQHGYLRREVKLCTIDVEGWEDKVFEGWDWETFRPEVLMVECLDDSTNWRQVIANRGYREVERTEKNIILRAS